MTAPLMVFETEVPATEGNVNGLLITWQADADRVKKFWQRSTYAVGQLWERLEER